MKNNEGQTIFSIIFPVYNSEKYVGNAIKSILNQKFSKIEIIIINDGSTDKSVKIIKKYQRLNRLRLRLLNVKKNKGVSNSRNLGLKVAKGDYIIFLDSDDYLENNILTSIKNNIIKNKFPDLILGNHNMQSIKKNLNNKMINKLNHNKKINIINNLEFFTGYCWAFIIKRAFISLNKIKFVNVKTHEDEIFISELISKSKSLSFLKKKFYFHNSITTSLSREINHKMLLSCVIGLDKIMKTYKTTSNQFKKKFIFERIRILTIHMLPLLFLINKKYLIKYSKMIKNKKKNFIKINKILKNEIFKLKPNYPLLEMKKIIQTSTLLKLNKDIKKSFYIFCMDKYGYATQEILKNKNFKIHGFLDNNKNYLKKVKFGTKHVTLKKLKKNSKIIICNQRKEHQKQILNQLIKNKISKSNIFIKSFSLNLREKLIVY